jgi:osmotically-inducible protein OsmY
MTNDELVKHVSDELHWDPKVDDGSIAVSAEDGTVTLRGTVGTFREKREAKTAAERVFGVGNVKNELTVRLMTHNRREEADLRADVLQALTLDSLVPSTIDAAVVDSTVTLTGTAERKFQVDEAEATAGKITGVAEVYDQVAIVGPPPDAGQVKREIENAYERSAKLDANELSVETEDHTVTVKGTVRSWAEHDDAIDAAWTAPGVREVHDRVVVLY